MVGIAMSDADPNMVVPGARSHIIGNNPVAYVVPAGEEHPTLLGIALSAVAAGKILGMKALGQAIPTIGSPMQKDCPHRKLETGPTLAQCCRWLVTRATGSLF